MQPECRFVKDLAQTFYYAAAAIAALGAFLTYVWNSRRERAKWLFQLYEKFYEVQTYKKMRELFDCDANSAEVQSAVQKEETDFTDYLNFFELVCCLVRKRQIRKMDVLDVFQYYLSRLKRHKSVAEYISTHGFEHLDRFLKEQSFE